MVKKVMSGTQKSQAHFPLAAPFSRPKKLSPPKSMVKKVMSGTQKSQAHSTSCAIFSLNWPPPFKKKTKKVFTSKY